MFIKIFISVLILLISTSNVLPSSNLYISAIVNDQVITNFDIQKEKSYLIILNPNLANLSNEKFLKSQKTH